MSATGARILVVDDEPQIHRFLRPALEAAGYVVERADTAAEGLRLAATRALDAVLLDLGLPDMDGQEALTRLRAFSRVPVVVVSARDREADDAVGNLAVVLAALGVFGTGTGWPDVIVATIMGGLGLWGGWQIVSQARGELRSVRLPQAVMAAE